MGAKQRFLNAAIGVFIGLFCFVLVANAATTETKKYSIATNLGLYGSYTWDIAVDYTDNNYVYLATYYSPNGFFFSHDGGDTWSGLPTGTDHGAGRAVEVDPTTGDVYALLNDLLVSTNHGIDYTVAAEFNNGASDMMFANNGLFVAVNDEVYVSTDKGENFTINTVCEDETVWSLAATTGAVFALCHNYTSDTDVLYLSDDGGVTWSNLDIATDGITDAEKVVVNPVSHNVFLVPSSLGGSTYRSSDNGATWTTLASAPSVGQMTFDINGRIYAGWKYSDDEGDTWTDFGPGGSYNHLVYPDPINPTILYDTTTPGFAKSVDSGATWVSSVENITGVEVTSIAQTTDKSVVWVATQNGPAKTVNFLDDEPIWNYVDMNNYNSSGYDAVWTKPSDGDTAVYSSSMNLEYTDDGGTTWNTSTVDITLTGAVFQMINDNDGKIYGAVGPNTSAGSQTGGVIMSEDDGATWTSLDFPSNGAVRSLAVASDGTLYAGTHSSLGGVYKYDGSWTKLDAPDDFEYISVLVDPDDDDIVYALATGNPGEADAGFYKSTDAGDSWEISNTGLGDAINYTEFNSLAVQTSTDPYTLYLSAVDSATNKGVIYKSGDNGDTWDKYYTGMKSEVFNALLFDGLMVGNSRGLYDMRSRVNFKAYFNKGKVKSGNKTILTLSLVDKVTGKKMAGEKIKLSKKVGKKKKKYWKTITLNSYGKKKLVFRPKNKTTIYAKWKMSLADEEEYAKPNNKTDVIKMK